MSVDNGFRRTALHGKTTRSQAASPKIARALSTAAPQAVCLTPDNASFDLTHADTSRGADQAPADASLSDQVLDAVTHGQTPRMAAQSLGQPLELIDLIVERLRAQGRLTVYDLTSCNCVTGEGCNPDPKSLVCASCPILPSQIRKRQSVFGRLKDKFGKLR